MSGFSWKAMAGAALALLLAGGVAGAQASNIPTVGSMKEALEASGQRHVPIVIDFSAEW